jgi:O-antigen/teichoic acid export membrane protein
MPASGATPSGGGRHITGGPALARNTLINLLGQVAPLPVALVTVPRIIEGIGTERFGFLSLASVFIAYFTLFDLSLGRALTTRVAEKIGASRGLDIPALVWTTAILVALLGVLGAAIVGALAPAIAYRALTLPPQLREEALHALYWIALGVPSMVLMSTLTGILAALQRFDVITRVRIPLTLFAYVSPLLVLPFTRNLSVMVAALVLGRGLGCFVYGVYTVRLLPALRHGVVFDRALMKPLLLFGGWMTVSNAVGSVMVYLDRFLIGVVVSVASVAYYTVPYDLATKVLVLPVALFGVLFPAFTTTFVGDRARTLRIYDRSLWYSFLTLFPVILLMVAFAREGLTLWLGESFAQHSFRVLQVIAFGVLLNSLAQPPFALIQGLGRPDLAARLHLLELPAYLIALWWALPRHGIAGAAVVWTVRVGVDLIALSGMAQRLFPATAMVHRRVVGSVAASLAAAAIYLGTLGPLVKVSSCAALLVLFGVIAWFSVLGEERARLGRWLKRVA